MNILLVEDDRTERLGIKTFLDSCKYNVFTASNGKEALEIIANKSIDLITTDIQMPVMDGIELLEKTKEINSKVPVIVITAFATVENAVKAMQKGAEDFLTKPVNLAELKLKIEKVIDRLRILNENENLKSKLDQVLYPDIITTSPKMYTILQTINKVVNDPNVTVMIYGNSGTGKELIAKNIHSKSNRKDASFVAVNCAALPEELLESELFGHVKGAFTGAVTDKIGLFEAANGGTIFLDEVSEMSPKLQAKLLRVLQEYEIQPIGKTKPINLDLRVVGASNINLKQLVEDGKFREDLYYRLNVVTIQLPSLKDRSDDIPLLINHFLGTNSRVEFSIKAMEILKKYSWPGNIRELQNFVKMIEVTSDEKQITEFDLPLEITQGVNKNSSELEKIMDVSDYKQALNEAIVSFEKNYLALHLNKNGGNISRTADSIGLSRVSLHKKIKEYGL